MNKKRKVLIVIALWMMVAFILYKCGFLITDINKIRELIGNNPLEMRLLFILLSTIRIMLFIPQTIFILVGSVVFGVYEGTLLSLIALFLSQSFMFFIGKYFGNDLLDVKKSKYKDIIEDIRLYGYRFLALGVICPVAPLDSIVFLTGLIGLKYKKVMATIIIVDIPMIILYSVVGGGINQSIFVKIFAVVAIAFISYYTFILWNKIKSSKK